jgi:hypothetical protein
MKSQHLLTTTCNLLILCNNIEITQSLPIINYVQVSTQSLFSQSHLSKTNNVLGKTAILNLEVPAYYQTKNCAP